MCGGEVVQRCCRVQRCPYRGVEMQRWCRGAAEKVVERW